MGFEEYGSQEKLSWTELLYRFDAFYVQGRDKDNTKLQKVFKYRTVNEVVDLATRRDDVNLVETHEQKELLHQYKLLQKSRDKLYNFCGDSPRGGRSGLVTDK
ncbi:MAG: hypothetical protein M1827_002228 [Pycnora praestabilis]|nr:MAG: hypothetical protein M1827_002228 [Pycnora praestabilis]